MSHTAIAQAIAARRSVYALNRELPLPPQDIITLIEDALRHAPSAFNSQSTRLQVLFGAEHEALWDIAADALRAVVPAEQFAATAEKLAAFRAAAGTILFFEDRDVIKGLQERMPIYADTFPGSADQGGAMLQYALWTLFSAAGIGANLQHYNPLIDDATRPPARRRSVIRLPITQNPFHPVAATSVAVFLGVNFLDIP